MNNLTNAIPLKQEWTSWSSCDHEEKKAIILKIAIAIIFASALATACAFSGIGALAFLATLPAEASTASFAIFGAYLGASAGLGIGTAAIPYFAIKFNLHRYNKKKNVRETVKFAAASLAFAATATAACAGLVSGTVAGLHIGATAIASSLKGLSFPKTNLSPPKIDIPQSALRFNF